ncbi:AAC(3) family N-acetyltransferase [Vibrio vulnificus]|uniref:AAC(3) family N-acetyltransferase n=1 Tax=Vibrio vulnificus TaxID=672 RepID=UPI001A32E78D|nr:AAC(3) family N-acetyltransferase [Vibrio vulnificus]MCA0772208.1 AAC(3) family N-acetyltransferase [Vibrio vulnificus]HAS6190388.1 hypothetical protein [Vibrio vulnificus]
MIKKVFSHFPHLEIFSRLIYYKLLRNQSNSRNQTKKNTNITKLGKKIFLDYLDSLDINDGDILIVHSAYEPLQPFNLSASDIVDILTERVGPNGTLVMPAFRRLTETPQGKTVCNLDSRAVTTGLIPSIFVRKPGVIRSQYPLNSLAAYGKHAKDMFNDELSSDLIHGDKSAWSYCIRENAKILLLGVDPSKTITAVHVAEDVLLDNWPIKNWYEHKSIILKTGTFESNIDVRVRRQFWSRYMVSEFRTRWLINGGFLKFKLINNIPFGFIGDSKGMLNLIMKNAETKQKNNMFFRPSKKHWR